MRRNSRTLCKKAFSSEENTKSLIYPRSNLFSVNFQTTWRKDSKVSWQATLQQYHAWNFLQACLLLGKAQTCHPSLHGRSTWDQQGVPGSAQPRHTGWHHAGHFHGSLQLYTYEETWLLTAERPSSTALPRGCYFTFHQRENKNNVISAVWTSCDFHFLGDSDKCLFT